MPCYYTGSREGDLELAYKEDTQKLAKKVTKLTQMLCLACRCLEQQTSDRQLHIKTVEGGPELIKWWQKHKKVDKNRKKKVVK